MPGILAIISEACSLAFNNRSVDTYYTQRNACCAALRLLHFCGGLGVLLDCWVQCALPAWSAHTVTKVASKQKVCDDMMAKLSGM